MFVRQSQLTLLDDAGTPISDAGSPSPGTSTATTPDDGGKSRSRLSRYVYFFFGDVCVSYFIVCFFLLTPLSFSFSNESVILKFPELCTSLVDTSYLPGKIIVA